MKKTLLLAALFLCCQAVSAQQRSITKDSVNIQSIELGEVMIKSKEPDKFSNKVRSENTYIVLNPTQSGVTDAKFDSTYFVTRFPQPEADSISLYAVEVKLKPYDTAMFDIKLLIYQVREMDTLRITVPVAGDKIDRKGKLRITLYDQQITLQPGEFYIGYGFHTKHIAEPFRYRMYATNKGEGAILTFQKDRVSITSNPHFPYVFPFRMSYRKY